MKKTLCGAVAVAMLCLTGCSATAPKHGSTEETSFAPDGTVTRKVVTKSDYALYIDAAKQPPAPVAKVKMPAPNGGEYAIEIPMVSGQSAMVQAPQPEVSAAERVADRVERWLGLGIKGLAIVKGADVEIARSHDARDIQLGTMGAFASINQQNAESYRQGWVTMGQMPKSNTFNVNGTATFGDNSPLTIDNSVRRKCTGGSGASGGAGAPAGTTTGGDGAPGGAGGSASC